MYGTAFMGFLGGGGNSLFAATPSVGTGATQGIITGQNLAAGSLVLGKNVSTASDWALRDTERGNTKRLITNDTAAEITDAAGYLNSFDGSGVTYGALASENTSGANCLTLSWLKQAGFLDEITYTGNLPSDRILTHDNGSPPGMIWLKGTSVPYLWGVYHKNLDATFPERYRLTLNATDARINDTTYLGSIAPTSTEINIGGGEANFNQNGAGFIAYSFAEKTGSSKFGNYTGTTTVNTGLGSLKAILTKHTLSSGDWYFFYNDSGTWYHVKLNTNDARATGLISVSGGDFTLSGAAGASDGIYAAWS